VKSIHVEPEALAAWSEGALASNEARQVEAHLADCAMCQEMLAVFARTEPPHAVSSGVGSVRSRFRSVVSGFLTAAASAKVVSRTNWRWAVPLAAAATVAAIWVARFRIEWNRRLVRRRPNRKRPINLHRREHSTRKSETRI